jgi:hypothetical protein
MLAAYFRHKKAALTRPNLYGYTLHTPTEIFNPHPFQDMYQLLWFLV